MKKIILLLITLAALKAPLLSQGYELWNGGANGDGQLGDTSFTTKPFPTHIGTESNWKTTTGGQTHTIAIKNDGTLWGWGSNSQGQLGLGNNGSTVPIPMDTVSNWKTIACGRYFTLAIKSDGTLWTTGDNFYGQLGDGTTGDRGLLKNIGTSTDWKSICASERHTVAIKTDGTLWAWGDNGGYQLGDGTTNDSHIPIQIGTATNWKTIACGGAYTLAIKTDGTLWGWGVNGNGQLGDGTNGDKNIPTKIGTDTDWKSIACGMDHTLAIKTDGTLWATGWNSSGQLGDGSKINKNTLTQIGTDSWLIIACGFEHTIALKTDGTLWTWGSNGSGECGNSSNSTPTLRDSRTNWKSVSAGGTHSMALKVPDPTYLISGYIKDEFSLPVSNITVNLSGTSKTTTQTNTDGSFSFPKTVIGDYTITPINTSSYTFSPELRSFTLNNTNISSGLDFILVSTAHLASGLITDKNSKVIPQITLNLTGASSTTTETKANGVYSFSNLLDGVYTITPQANGSYTFSPLNRNIKIAGSNIKSGLDFEAVPIPYKISGSIKDAQNKAIPDIILSVSGIENTTHTIVDGSYTFSDLINHGTYTITPLASSSYSFTPSSKTFTISDVNIASGLDFVGVSISQDTSGYELWSWGSNDKGQLGDGTNLNRIIPSQIDVDSDWKFATAGLSHTVAIKKDGTLWSWGWNSKGQLGDGSNLDKQIPTKIGINTDWKIISAGGNHTLAIKKDGSLWAFGRNDEGQLGNGTNISQNTPTKIGTDTDWKDISAGESHSLALKTDGTLWSWGLNTDNQLGDGTALSKNKPQKVWTSNNWLSIIAENKQSLALKIDGSLWAWGANNVGQLGDGTNINRLVPTLVGNENDWKAIAPGWGHTIALKNDSTMWAWGANNVGQLGDGYTTNEKKPIKIGLNNKWKEVYAKGSHSLALKNDSTLWAWGYNREGEIGDSTNIDKVTPTKIGNFNNWKSISAGVSHTLALKVHVPTYSIMGFVKDTSNKAVADITLNLSGISGTFSTQTKADGSYSFLNLKNGFYTITPIANSSYSFSPVSKTCSIANANLTNGLDFIAISSNVPTYTISGIVNDSFSKALPGITLKISGVSSTTTQTKADGSYIFSKLLEGVYIVSPQDTSFYTFTPSSRTITIKNSNISGLDFVAIKKNITTYSIAGTIKNEKNQAISGINVELTGVASKTTQTKADGTYSFSTLLKGSYTVTPQSNASYTFSPISIASDISTSDISGVDFTAIQKTGVSTYLLSGLVFDLDNNIELPNVAINISGDVSANLLSDKLGKYSIILSKGSYTITPVISGFTFSPSYQTLNIISDTTFNFTANVIKFKVSGKVVDNNKLPISNLLITTNTGKSTKSIIDGNYEFLLRPGNYTIKPDLSSYKSVPDSINVTVSNSDIPNNDFILTVSSVTYNISGDVVDASGLGIANIEVILSSKIVKTDANGKFIFNNIAEGIHVIVPSSSEYYFEPTYSEITLNSNMNNIKFKAIKLTELPSCLSSRDTTLPSVYVFDPYLASKRGFVEVNNDCSEDYTITDIALSGNSNQFKILNPSDFLPLVIPSFKSVNIPIEFKPTKAGLDSVYMRLIFGQKQKAVKVKSAGVDGGPGLPYTVLTMKTKPESAKPGEKVELYLLVPKSSNYTLTTNDYYEAVYTIKTQLVADLDTISTPNITKINTAIPYTGISYPGKSNPNGFTTVKFQGRFVPSYAGKSPSFVDTLAKFRYIATLGNQDSTNIIINDFKWLSGGAKAEIYNDGVFRIIPCEAGGERLIGWKSQSKVTLQSIAPNPTSDNITLKINSSVELENSEIEIINVLGISLLKSNYIINKGDSEIKLDLKNVPSGFYTIRLNKDIQSVFFKE